MKYFPECKFVDSFENPPNQVLQIQLTVENPMRNWRANMKSGITQKNRKSSTSTWKSGVTDYCTRHLFQRDVCNLI